MKLLYRLTPVSLVANFYTGSIWNKLTEQANIGRNVFIPSRQIPFRDLTKMKVFLAVLHNSM